MIINIFKALINKIKNIFVNPLNDPRCKDCVHIDGPICPYPKECSAMKSTCYNCKYSVYGAGPEYCELQGQNSMISIFPCCSHEYYK